MVRDAAVVDAEPEQGTVMSVDVLFLPSAVRENTGLTAQEIAKLEKFMREASDYVSANSRRYKVCEGCERAVLQQTTICGVCGAYRFDSDRSRILRRVEMRLTLPLEVAFATLPRVDWARLVWTQVTNL